MFLYHKLLLLLLLLLIIQFTNVLCGKYSWDQGDWWLQLDTQQRHPASIDVREYRRRISTLIGQNHASPMAFNHALPMESFNAGNLRSAANGYQGFGAEFGPEIDNQFSKLFLEQNSNPELRFLDQNQQERQADFDTLFKPSFDFDFGKGFTVGGNLGGNVGNLKANNDKPDLALDSEIEAIFNNPSNKLSQAHFPSQDNLNDFYGQYLSHLKHNSEQESKNQNDQYASQEAYHLNVIKEEDEHSLKNYEQDKKKWELNALKVLEAQDAQDEQWVDMIQKLKLEQQEHKQKQSQQIQLLQAKQIGGGKHIPFGQQQIFVQEQLQDKLPGEHGQFYQNQQFGSFQQQFDGQKLRALEGFGKHPFGSEQQYLQQPFGQQQRFEQPKHILQQELFQQLRPSANSPQVLQLGDQQLQQQYNQVGKERRDHQILLQHYLDGSGTLETNPQDNLGFQDKIEYFPSKAFNLGTNAISAPQAIPNNVNEPKPVPYYIPNKVSTGEAPQQHWPSRPHLPSASRVPIVPGAFPYMQPTKSKPVDDYVDVPYYVDVPHHYAVLQPVPRIIKVPHRVKVDAPFPQPYDAPYPRIRPYPVPVRREIQVPVPHPVEVRVHVLKPYPVPRYVKVDYPVYTPVIIPTPQKVFDPYPVMRSVDVQVPIPRSVAQQYSVAAPTSRLQSPVVPFNYQRHVQKAVPQTFGQNYLGYAIPGAHGQRVRAQYPHPVVSMVTSHRRQPGHIQRTHANHSYASNPQYSVPAPFPSQHGRQGAEWSITQVKSDLFKGLSTIPTDDKRSRYANSYSGIIDKPLSSNVPISIRDIEFSELKNSNNDVYRSDMFDELLDYDDEDYTIEMIDSIQRRNRAT